MRYLVTPLTAVLFLAGCALPLVAFAQQLNVPSGNASLNWAGYVAQGNPYTAVSGSWVVPIVSTTPVGTADATWVGIGGVSSQDLIQAGTQAIVSAQGAITYNAWIETLPNFSQTVPLSVSPGDAITASITQESPGAWTISIMDVTTRDQYTTALTYASSLSSAEWVEEMVSQGNGAFRPLDNFGSLTFTGGSTTVQGTTESIAQSGAQPLEMINATGQVLASPSALGANGASFTVSRTSAAPTTERRHTRWHLLETATSTSAMPMPFSFHRRFGSFPPSSYFPTSGGFTLEWR